MFTHVTKQIKSLMWLVVLIVAMVTTTIIYIPIVIIYSFKTVDSSKYWYKQSFMFDVLIASALDMKYPTISQTIGRSIKDGYGNWFTKALCSLLDKIDKDHCKKYAGE